MNSLNFAENNSLSEFLLTKYNIRGSIIGLVGYQDRNWLITSDSGEKFILKITTDVNDLDFIGSQNRVLAALSQKPFGKLIPCPVSTINGDLITEIYLDGRKAFARVLTFVSGTFIAESIPDISFYYDLGKVFAQIDHDMNGLEDTVLKCRSHEWALGRVMEIEEDVHLIADPSDRRLVHYFLMKYREEVLPVYHKLPKCLIHGDGNDWNVLVADKGDRVAGVIDFGDMVWGARIEEVSIVLAYAMMGRKDFVEVYRQVIAGYHDVIMLSAIELSVVYYLVAARWCQTMVMAARKNKTCPAIPGMKDNQENTGNDYHQVSVSGASSMLHQWIRQNPAAVNLNSPDQATPESLSREVEKRYKYFSSSVSLSYNQAIQMVGAAMQYMYGADGRTYLDCVNNIPHVGHCHPKVVEAGQKQMSRLNTNTRYLYSSLDRYAEKLLSKFPPSLNKVFFVNSGSAATDLAVRLAEAHTGKSEYLVLDYAYHGNTKAAIGLSPYKFNRKGGKGKPGNVTILPSAIDPFNRHTFFAESIVGCAGQIVLQKDFMQQTINQVRESGGIYVADEVQTGFGRVGHKFWGYELYDVVPDMVILGKPMGNGHPMGAVVCTEEICRSFETGMEFFSSFGGNPVSCEIGLAVLNVMEEEGLQENARQVGDFLLSEFNQLINKVLYLSSIDFFSPPLQTSRIPFHISSARGSGLFLGFELTNTENGKPATEAAVFLVNEMKEKGFLLSTDGPFNNVIKFKPPMCFSMNNAVEMLSAFNSFFAARH